MNPKLLTVPSKILISFLIITSLSIVFIPLFFQSTKSTSPILDNHITINSSRLNSDGSIKVNYTVDSSYTNGNVAPISIGYRFPYKYRLGTNFHKSKEINYNKGTYTLTIPKPDYNLIGSLAVSIELSSRYTESRYINEFSQLSATK